MKGKRANIEKGNASPTCKSSFKKVLSQKIHKKFRPKVAQDTDKSTPPPKHWEPMEIRSESMTQVSPSKDKDTAQVSSHQPSTHSASSSDETIREVVERMMANIDAGPSNASKAQSIKSMPATTRSLIEEEIDGPPSDFNTKPLLQATEKKRYKDLFSARSMCPVVYVDLAHLRDHLGFNLYEYLDHYQKWLQIDLSFSPSVVRTFYSNLCLVKLKKSKRESVEERLETTVRGQKIQLSPFIINSYLGYDEKEFDETPSYNKNQIFEIIKPVKKVKKFSSMCLRDDYRVLWYIYTRVLVNKYDNFNHFSSRDFNNLAVLISGVKIDVGKFIYEELNRYRIASNKHTPTPFPQLVSLFLKLNNIWYLEGEHNRLAQFGKTQIKKMKIGLSIHLLEESLSKRKRVEPEASKGDEAHSSRAPSPPSFLRASIQVQIQEALKPMVEEIQKNNQLLLASMQVHIQEALKPVVEQIMKKNELFLTGIENQVQDLIGGVTKDYRALYQVQANFIQDFNKIKHKLDCLETRITEGSLSKAPVLDVPTCTNLPTVSPPQSRVPSTSPTQPSEPTQHFD